MRLNSTATGLIYSTFLGGAGTDRGSGVAIDGNGNAYVAGSTDSTDFPTKNPWEPTYGGGGSDAFTTKVNALGTALLYSTYLGGSGDDAAAYALAAVRLIDAYKIGLMAPASK